MDRHALERLGHYIVSRRLALGYRNRTDLANSLQFTVRTLADIEHGVRKASPGTYAMLENKLAWAPGSIDTILAGGEPNELVVKLRRAHPRSPVPRRHRRALPCLHRRAAAGAATAHHHAPRGTRSVGRLGRPEPSRRLARGGLAAPKISGGAVDHADPDAGLAPGEQQFVNDLVAVGWTPTNGYRAMVAVGYSVCDLGFGVGQLALFIPGH